MKGSSKLRAISVSKVRAAIPSAGLPAGDEGIEGVEAAVDRHGQAAALGRIGVRLGQGHKIRGEVGLAIHSYAMLRFGPRRKGGQGKGDGASQGGRG